MVAPRIAPEVLRPSRLGAVGLLLVSSGFVAGGLWMAQSEGWLGYACAGFFGLCALVAVVQLIPGASYLAIDQHGLTIRNLFRTSVIAWREVDHFVVVTQRTSGIKTHEMVGFIASASAGAPGVGRKLARAVAGCDGALPDTYGCKAAALAAHLNELLARTRAAAG